MRRLSASSFSSLSQFMVASGLRSRYQGTTLSVTLLPTGFGAAIGDP